MAYNEFNPDDVLVKFSTEASDTWTVDDAMKGTSIIGGTGSGKTTASGKKIALSFLEKGWGGLVLCAKTDEADLWKSYCKQTNRERDLIIFGSSAKVGDSPMIFNPIDYELKRSGEGAGQVQNLTNIFMNIYRMGNRITGDNEVKEERFWDSAIKRCLNRVIQLLKLSHEDLSYKNIVNVLDTSSTVVKAELDILGRDYKKNEKFPDRLNESSQFALKCFFNAYIKNCYKVSYTNEIAESLDQLENYFTESIPNMGSRTKTIIFESILGLTEPFTLGLLKKHFAGSSNIFPEWSYANQQIIVLDFPVKEYLEAGLIAQSVFKLSFQQAVERRDVSEFPKPVFLWCDEAHYYVNPYDQIFLTTARSSRTATVFLSQNVPNYYSAMGSKADAKSKVDSLLGNLSTKIFHANSDAETNEYASRLIGHDITYLKNQSNQESFLGLNFSHTKGLSATYAPQVQPRQFTTLQTGGRKNSFKVQGVLIQSGREWSNKKNFLIPTFTQNFDDYE